MHMVIAARKPAPTELTDDLKSAELIEVLEHLQFINGRSLISIDRGIRSFLATQTETAPLCCLGFPDATTFKRRPD